MANNNAILRGGAAAEMSLDELFGAVEQEWQDQALCAQTDPCLLYTSPSPRD